MKFNLNNKNAYVQIDFTFAIFLFFIFFMTIYGFYEDNSNSLDYSFKYSKVNSESVSLCKLLLNSGGSPNNWESNIGNLIFLGLLNESSNFIDSNKVSILNSTNYQNVTDFMNLNYVINFKLINVSTNYSYLDFGFSSKNYFPKYNSISSCYGILDDGSDVKLIVEVWE